MAAGKHRENHDVNFTHGKEDPSHQMQTTCGQHVRELVLGVNMFDLDLGSKLILSNNQSSATLWVWDKCLIVDLLPIMVILITASLSSKINN